jgi:hypothetical protein
MIEQRRVGKSGLLVSSIGLGCNNFGRSLDLAASRPVIHKALDLGISFFDCADVYGRRGGAETILAQVLGAQPAGDGGGRQALRRASLTDYSAGWARARSAMPTRGACQNRVPLPLLSLTNGGGWSASHSSFHRLVTEGILPPDLAGDVREVASAFGE